MVREHTATVSRARRDAVTNAWASALAQSGYIALSPRELRQRLGMLTDLAIQELFSNELDSGVARSIGMGLARIGYTHPQVLGQTLRVLGQQLGGGVLVDTFPADAEGLRHRLSALLAELATGFAAESRANILREQETIHQALVAQRDDVTQALRDSESRFRAIFEGSPFGIAVAEMDGRITAVNPALAAILGYSAAEMHGRVILAELVHPDDAAAGWEAFGALATGRCERYAIEQRFFRKDGEVIWARLAMSLVRDAEGHPQFAIGMGEDVTERKRVDSDLKEARDSALAASRAKSEFLANMSHEIRTPLNAILGMADVLADTSLDPNQQQYVGIFRRAGDSLLTLIDDILDLSKVDAGHLRLENTEFDMRALVEGAAEVLSVSALSKGLQLTCAVDPDVPLRVRGDPQRLRQVLLNLLGNAVKFTTRGEVGIRVEHVGPPGTTGGPLALRFVVSDTGMGIAPEMLETVFDAFTQVDTSSTRRHGGSGLGLAIVKRLVELMGGQLQTESTLGRGSTFAFIVPLQAAASALAPSLGSPDLEDMVPGSESSDLEEARPLRLLLVDDSEDNRQVIQFYFQDLPHVVDTAADGREGVTAFMSDQYDLVLMDVHMPVLNGLEATRAIRAWEREHRRPPTPIIALTASVMADDVQRALAAGCDLHLAKPLKKAILLETVDRYARRPLRMQEPAPQADDDGGCGPSGKRIVVHVDVGTRALTERYIDNRRADVLAMSDELAGGNYESIWLRGHKMKGDGGTFGLNYVTELGAALEAAAESRDAAGVRRSADRLAEYLPRLDVRERGE